MKNIVAYKKVCTLTVLLKTLSTFVKFSPYLKIIVFSRYFRGNIINWMAVKQTVTIALQLTQSICSILSANYIREKRKRLMFLKKIFWGA